MLKSIQGIKGAPGRSGGRKIQEYRGVFPVRNVHLLQARVFASLSVDPHRGLLLEPERGWNEQKKATGFNAKASAPPQGYPGCLFSTPAMFERSPLKYPETVFLPLGSLLLFSLLLQERRTPLPLWKSPPRIFSRANELRDPAYMCPRESLKNKMKEIDNRIVRVGAGSIGRVTRLPFRKEKSPVNATARVFASNFQRARNFEHVNGERWMRLGDVKEEPLLQLAGFSEMGFLSFLFFRI